MIDTKEEILREDILSGLYCLASEKIISSSYHDDVEELFNKIDELERKLKIAEDALDCIYNIDGKYIDHVPESDQINLMYCDVILKSGEALKQIRGDE